MSTSRPTSAKPTGVKEGQNEVNVQVVVRCRPANKAEIEARIPAAVKCDEANREVMLAQSIAGKTMERTFTFDRVFGQNSKQEDVYDSTVRPIVNEVLEGFNCTIFAYGQTGTGKTHTMEGDIEKQLSGGLSQNAGVIPRAVKQIFDTLETAEAEYSVKVTFLELYNEEITDLLDTTDINDLRAEKKKIAMMEDSKGGVNVRGLEEEIVKSSNEIFTLLRRGSEKRRTAETLLNKQSSRSHSVFCITIHIKESTPEGEELIKCGKLNLVDLAGSENISRSGAKDTRAREAGEINKSLLTLGRVITALVDHLSHVPYRESKLTRLLRDSLGGTTKTCIIATVSPAGLCMEESMSTLDYAHRAKNIRNRPTVNQKMTKTALIKDMNQEIERLKQDLVAAREKNGVYLSQARYEEMSNESRAMQASVQALEEQIEVKQKELEELQNMFDGQTRQFENLQETHEVTCQELQQTQDNLQKTQSDLEAAKEGIEERDYLIGVHEKSEVALSKKAVQLQIELQTTAKDVSGLFDKLERKAEVENVNAEVVDSLRKEAESRLAAMEAAVGALVEQQRSQYSQVQETLQQFMQRKQRELEEMKSQMGSMMQAVVKAAEGAVKAASTQHDAAGNVLGQVQQAQGEYFIAAQQETQAAHQAAQDAFQQLLASLSAHKDQLGAFAEQQKASANAALTRAKQIATETKAALDGTRGKVARTAEEAAGRHQANEAALAKLMEEYEETAAREKATLMEQISQLVHESISRKQALVARSVSGLREGMAQGKDALVSSLDAVVQSVAAAGESLDAGHEQCQVAAEKDMAAVEGWQAQSSEAVANCAGRVGEMQAAQTKVFDEQAARGEAHSQALDTMVSGGMETLETSLEECKSAVQAEKDVAAEAHASAQGMCESATSSDQQQLQDLSQKVSSWDASLEGFCAEHTGKLSSLSGRVHTALQDEYRQDVPTAQTPAKRQIPIPTRESIEDLRTPEPSIVLAEYRQQKAATTKDTADENETENEPHASEDDADEVASQTSVGRETILSTRITKRSGSNREPRAPLSPIPNN